MEKISPPEHRGEAFRDVPARRRTGSNLRSHISSSENEDVSVAPTATAACSATADQARPAYVALPRRKSSRFGHRNVSEESSDLEVPSSETFLSGDAAEEADAATPAIVEPARAVASAADATKLKAEDVLHERKNVFGEQLRLLAEKGKRGTHEELDAKEKLRERSDLSRKVVQAWQVPEERLIKRQQQKESHLSKELQLVRAEHAKRDILLKEKFDATPEAATNAQREGQFAIHSRPLRRDLPEESKYSRCGHLFASQLLKKQENDLCESLRETRSQAAEENEGEREHTKAFEISSALSASEQQALESLLLEERADDAALKRQRWRITGHVASPAERCTQQVAEKLLRDRPPLFLVSERQDEHKEGEPRPEEVEADYSMNPENPLPFVKIGKGEELLALKRLERQSRQVAAALDEKLPFADISWSRQPSFDEFNVNQVLHLRKEETLHEFPLTENVRSSHERVRLAASSVAAVLSEPRTDAASVWWNLKDVISLYLDPHALEKAIFLHQQFTSINSAVAIRERQQSHKQKTEVPAAFMRAASLRSHFHSFREKLDKMLKEGSSTAAAEMSTAGASIITKAAASSLVNDYVLKLDKASKRTYEEQARTAGLCRLRESVPSSSPDLPGLPLLSLLKGDDTAAAAAAATATATVALSNARDAASPVNSEIAATAEAMAAAEAALAGSWLTSKYSLAEAELNEDLDRLRILRNCLRECMKDLGPRLLSHEPPPSALLQSLLQTPEPLAFACATNDSGQQLVGSNLLKANFWVELIHNIWLPLLLERFSFFEEEKLQYDSAAVPSCRSCCYSYYAETNLCDWCYFSGSLPRMFRLATYLLTGFLESRVPGIHRLLFRLNCALFFAYRIELSLFYGASRGGALTSSKKTDQKGKSKLRCSNEDEHSSFSTNISFRSNIRAASNACKNGVQSKFSDVFLAKERLQRCLQCSTTSHALRYNIEAINMLWIYALELDSSYAPSKEELCKRLFHVPLTRGFFELLATHEVPDIPAAVHFINAYFELLTHFLYGARSATFMRELTAVDKEDEEPGTVWNCLLRALQQPPKNILLLRDILRFLSDLVLLACLDKAPLFASTVQKMQKALEDVAFPALTLRRPDLCNEETWEHIAANVVALRDALQLVLDKKPFPLNLLRPFACRGRLVASEDSECCTIKNYGSKSPQSLFAGSSAKRSYPYSSASWPSLSALYPLPSRVPCWRPGCPRDLALTAENLQSPLAAHMRYCKGCYVASYCSDRCQEYHWQGAHRTRCKYFRSPPTFSRFQLLPSFFHSESLQPFLFLNVFRGFYEYSNSQLLESQVFKPIF